MIDIILEGMIGLGPIFVILVVVLKNKKLLTFLNHINKNERRIIEKPK